ncbi:hypothetical protein TNCV_13121 [Trichonephila clavipes]|nr:hypothetical protein TNCV_13121 [Trichonephila clavipes]
MYVKTILFTSTPQRISWRYFEAIGSIQIVTVKISNHQSLDDGMRWRTVERLEAGCDEIGLFPQIAKGPLADRRWENSRHFPNFWERISELGGQRFRPFSPDCPRRQKETH